jgi:hypothetical protein
MDFVRKYNIFGRNEQNGIFSMDCLWMVLVFVVYLTVNYACTGGWPILIMKSSFSLDVMPYCSLKVRYFRRMCCLHFQGKRINQSRNHHEADREQKTETLICWLLPVHILHDYQIWFPLHSHLPDICQQQLQLWHFLLCINLDCHTFSGLQIIPFKYVIMICNEINI